MPRSPAEQPRAAQTHGGLTPTVAAGLIAARRVGAPLRACAAAVGVPWRSVCRWLQTGRAEGATGPCADLAVELDRAHATTLLGLYTRVLAATEGDGRLAFDVLRWHDAADHRAALADLARARARTAKAEAKAAVGDGATLSLPAGLLVARVEPVYQVDPVGEFMARLDRLGAAEGPADG